jgi:DNA polymerase III subunit delta
MLIFLYGTDSYRSRRKLDEIVKNFREREDKAGMNTAVFNAAKTDIGDIQQALFAPAFLGNKRLVVIRGLLAMKRDEQKPFVDLVGKLPDSTTAVFYETADAKILEKSPLLPLLTAGKFHWEFSPMNAGQMADWASAEAARLGVSFAPPALAALVEAVGGDTARAANETAKLVAYVGAKKTIELADVAALVIGEAQDDMFGFLDAVANKQAKSAADMLEQQIASGSEPMQLLAMLARTVRLLIMAKDMLESGMPQNEAIKELGVHPFAARKALTQACGFEMRALQNLHAALLEADRRIKTGSISTPRLALDLIVARAVS